MTRSLRDTAIAARTLADDTFAAWCAGKATGEAGPIVPLSAAGGPHTV